MSAAGGTVPVLAAEDNEINRVVLEGLLAHARPDIALTLVHNGRDAVDAWRGGAFALILMDVRMPVMDGRAATRAIRAEEAATGRAPTPVVALTAESSHDELQLCRDAGMDGYVSKPFELDALLAAIDAALGAHG
jgi:two-component system, sensor histidine kinase